MPVHPDILGLGEPLIEMVLVPERLRDRPTYVQGFGGDTSTAMIAAARQGAKAGYLTAVGGDMFGRAMLDLWAREGVDASHVGVRDGDPTGVCFIAPHASGRNFTYARRGSAASLYGPDDLPADAIAAAKVLHVSGISLGVSETMRRAVFRAVEIARAAGTLVSLDVNLRPALWPIDLARETILAVARQADIVFPSDDEAEILIGTRDPEAVAAHFLGLGAKIVAVKRGENGALLGTTGGTTPIPPAPSDPVDASGAGDTFAGAFLAYHLETGDPILAARRAAVAAAGTVSGLGAVEPIPRRAEVLARV